MLAETQSYADLFIAQVCMVARQGSSWRMPFLSAGLHLIPLTQFIVQIDGKSVFINLPADQQSAKVAGMNLSVSAETIWLSTSAVDHET
jgi:hypothetical protein